MQGIDITIVGRSTTKRSAVIIDQAAKWRKVEIKGWNYDVGQGSKGVLLKPAAASNRPSCAGFELPGDGVGVLGIEIQVNEPIMVCCNDNTIMVASPEAGTFRTVILHCVPATQAALARLFTLSPMP